MKANELMIGDWVVYNGDVDYTNPIQIEGMDIATGSLITSDREDVGFDGIEPIPLTKEILEKNGVEDFDCSFHFPEDDCLWLELNWEEDGLKWTVNYNEYDILPLDYVHELQHALRLCGIDKEIVL